MKQLKLVYAFLLAVLTLSMIGCAPTPQREGTGEYVDDTVITTKVKAAILAEPSLKFFQINVETFKGTVQLSGFVKTHDEVNRASEVSHRVGGVQAVKNDIRLR